MLKQYLIAKSFTRGNTPLEYEYTVEKCDLRTRLSKNREKYVWYGSHDKLYTLACTYEVKMKLGSRGEIRLIMLNGAMAYSFLKAIRENGWKGVK